MDAINQFLSEHGTITNEEAKKLGLKRHILSKMVKDGKLARVKNGVYTKKYEILDDFVLISSKNERMVFSYQTALFLHGLSDRTPNIFHISVPQGYNASHIKKKHPKITVHYVKAENFDMGITSIQTPLGNTVNVYDKERSICDIVSDRKNLDKQIYVDAITRYFKEPNAKLRVLIKYSRAIGVEEEIRKYMEVLK